MVVEAVRTTLGPRGMDKLIVDRNGKSTISNDGATIMKLLDIVHPAAKTLVDIAKSQDAEVCTSYCQFRFQLSEWDWNLGIEGVQKLSETDSNWLAIVISP